jgi:hypothetical protein
VLATTFPMWLSGRRLAPTFTYTPLPGEPLELRDEVRYQARTGRARSIVGIDRFDPATGGFVWRGRHLLSPLRSRWRLVYLSEDGELAALTFERSLVTPAGADVIGRGPNPRPGTNSQVSAELLGLEPAQFDALSWL